MSFYIRGHQPFSVGSPVGKGGGSIIHARVHGGASTHTMHGAVPRFCSLRRIGTHSCTPQHRDGPFSHSDVRWQPIFMSRGTVLAHFHAMQCGGPFSHPKAWWQPFFMSHGHGTNTSGGGVSRGPVANRPRPLIYINKINLFQVILLSRWEMGFEFYILMKIQIQTHPHLLN